MSDRTIPTVVFLAGWLSAIGAAVGDENSPPAGPKPRPEVIAALQELAKLPHDERRKQFTETIAQLPPDPVPGDPSRAKQLLVAAIKKFDDDAQGALSFAPPEKTAPLLIEALADPDQGSRHFIASTIGTSLRVAAGAGRSDGPKLFAAAIPILAKKRSPRPSGINTPILDTPWNRSASQEFCRSWTPIFAAGYRSIGRKWYG